MKLEPPSANGKLTVLTSDPTFANADIMSWDLSFDAQTIVFSARLADSTRYQLFTMNVDGSNWKQITDGDNDRVYPIFLPGQQVLFMTNENVEPGTPQFKDEYERAVTAQVATINVDGTNMQLGPRNVSHRVAPTLLPDGHVLYTEWRHLGNNNDGHLRLMNTDMTGMREAFGSELALPCGKSIPNSFLRARYVDTYQTPDGQDAFRVVAIGTSRDRTLQAGKLLRIDLGKSEATSSCDDMTNLVPGDRAPSVNGVGRYYDAEVVGAPKDGKFLASWADGPVESEVLAMFNTVANFRTLCLRLEQRYEIPAVRRSPLLGRAGAANRGASGASGDGVAHRGRWFRGRCVECLQHEFVRREHPRRVGGQGSSHRRILRRGRNSDLRLDGVRRTVPIR